MEQQEYLQNFEKGLAEQLTKMLSDKRLLGGYTFEVEELTELWHRCAPDYMADAVPQIADYPLAAIAWAAYFGAGAAVMWDKQTLKADENTYLRLRDARGFDELDEYVAYLMLDAGIKQPDIDRVEDALRSAAISAETAIRKEGIEPQSVMAFHIFARVVKVFFALGASITLHLMGYKYEKVKVDLPS
ncbi:MAG: hypothetical protein IJ286_07230 [Alistipes sp.]|nr:hypothetical protein [Alistipes sp.]